MALISLVKTTGAFQVSLSYIPQRSSNAGSMLAFPRHSLELRPILIFKTNNKLKHIKIQTELYSQKQP